MKKRKYVVSSILCMAFLLIYPLYAGIYTRSGDDDFDVGGPIGECPKEHVEDDILLPDEVNCAVFYECDWGVPVLMLCPDGLLFNATFEVCDWPEYVNCDRFWFRFDQL